MRIGAYFRLMRFHKPIGILLLWFPTAWALWVANDGKPGLDLVFYFALGTIVMRAAGCIVNDIADRHIDPFVVRTKNRPLASGIVHLKEAFLLLAFLLLIALWIVMQLPIACFYYAIVALVITVLYPFCKRFLSAPQLVLGIAFSMGIPMAFAASDCQLDFVMVILFILNFAWILSYDTIYAMADKEDDIRIGVKSTAILFGEYDRLILLLLQITFHFLWLFISFSLGFSWPFYVAWMLASSVLIYQQYLIAPDSFQSKKGSDLYITAFSSNSWYGLLLWCGLCIH